MQTPLDFTRQLVKGRVAETIFSQMFRESKKYTVLEFGYEKIVPELVQGGYTEHSNIIETLRTAPDFAIINNDLKKVRLVEVKYRKHLYPEEILRICCTYAEFMEPIVYVFVYTRWLLF